MRAIPLLLLLTACGDPAAEPSATVLSAMPEALVLGDDTRNDLTITISYADGDGDLGRGVAHVHDCRAAGLVTELMLPSIATDEAVAEGIAITGELALLVNDIGAVTPEANTTATCAELGAPAPTSGEVVFCITLTDAGGATGAGDCTAPVALTQP